VVLVPEGLIEFIPEMGTLIGEINEILSKPFEGAIREHVNNNLTKNSHDLFNFLPSSISNQLLLDRDPHGNVQVSKIDTEKLLILLLQTELRNRRQENDYNGTFKPLSNFFGYEGRCALPSNFDSQYCYSLGLNAAVLIREGVTGYMSCVKNLTDKNPCNWQAAGCPLPTMMGIERRHGADKPVISKALVRLDGGMFKAYAAVRELWAMTDAYKSPGPIQFQGAASDEINFMVQPPNIEQLVKEAKRNEEIEKSGNRLLRDFDLLSELSQSRVKDVATIPQQFEKGHITVSAVKKYFAQDQHAKELIDEQLPLLKQHQKGNYFVEV
jgi:pyrophosphate--fructose-6-phosphate 1-phosphotransferase